MSKQIYFLTLIFFFVSTQSAFAAFEGLKKKLNEAKEKVQQKVTTFKENVTRSSKEEQKSKFSKKEIKQPIVFPFEKLTAEDYNQLKLDLYPSVTDYLTKLHSINNSILTSLQIYESTFGKDFVAEQKQNLATIYDVGRNLGKKLEKLQKKQVSTQELKSFQEEVKKDNKRLSEIRINAGNTEQNKINQTLKWLVGHLHSNGSFLLRLVSKYAAPQQKQEVSKSNANNFAIMVGSITNNTNKVLMVLDKITVAAGTSMRINEPLNVKEISCKSTDSCYDSQFSMSIAEDEFSVNVLIVEEKPFKNVSIAATMSKKKEKNQVVSLKRYQVPKEQLTSAKKIGFTINLTLEKNITYSVIEIIPNIEK